jgi:SAM-dependent methyltransferase
MNCPACHADEATRRYRLPRYAIVRCDRCRLLYNRDFPDDDRVPETFDERYYHDVQREAFASIEDPSADASRAIYQEGLAFVERARGVGSLLDIGCAFGVFMQIASARGWNVKGVEVSPYASRYAREQCGLDVVTGSGATVPHPDNSFDLVTMWDVLEHVRDARASVRAAARWLKPGGYFLVTTDNYDSLLSRLGGAVYAISLGMCAYPIERFYIPFNSCYFTRRDVSALFGNAGLQESYFRGIDYPIGKIKLGVAEKQLLRVLYGLGERLGMNSQFMMIARKPNAA